MKPEDIEAIAALREAAIAEAPFLDAKIRDDLPAARNYFVAMISLAPKLIRAARGEIEDAAGEADFERLSDLRDKAKAEGNELPVLIRKGRPAALAYVQGLWHAVPGLIETAREKAAMGGCDREGDAPTFR